MKEYYGQEVKMQLPLHIFKIMNRKEISFNELEKIREDWIDFRHDQFGDSYCNDNVILFYKEHLFKFGCYEDVFNLWDNDDIFLGAFYIEKECVPTEEFLQWVYNIIEQYIKHILHCSDCNKEIQENEIAGRYFAGIYCKECWDREWREREARETYD